MNDRIANDHAEMMLRETLAIVNPFLPPEAEVRREIVKSLFKASRSTFRAYVTAIGRLNHRLAPVQKGDKRG